MSRLNENMLNDCWCSCMYTGESLEKVGETFIVIHTEIGADDSLLNDFVSRIIMVIGKY